MLTDGTFKLKFSLNDFDAVVDFAKLTELGAVGALISVGARSHAPAMRRRKATAVRDRCSRFTIRLLGDGWPG
jgi:hypothetical protein